MRKRLVTGCRDMGIASPGIAETWGRQRKAPQGIASPGIASPGVVRGKRLVAPPGIAETWGRPTNARNSPASRGPRRKPQSATIIGGHLRYRERRWATRAPFVSSRAPQWATMGAPGSLPDGPPTLGDKVSYPISTGDRAQRARPPDIHARAENPPTPPYEGSRPSPE